jgi:hypothetical protein
VTKYQQQNFKIILKNGSLRLPFLTSYKVYYVNFRKIKNLTINNNKELKYDFIENLVLDTKIGFPKATRS